MGLIEVNGIKVTDSQHRSVVEVARVKTDLGLLNAIRDPRAREAVIVPFLPADRIEPGALAAQFDIVLAV
jgi:hypothetical protein